MNSTIYFILWAALLQGFFLALVYIFSKRNRSFANTLLGLFLISVILEALKANLPWNRVGNYNIAEYFSIPEVKLFIPVLLFHFVLEKLGKTRKYVLFLSINYIAAILIGSITLYNLYLFAVHSSSIVGQYDFLVIDRTHLLLQSYAFLMSVFVLAISLREISHSKRLVEEELSNYNMLQIKWLWRFIFLLIPAALFWGAEIFRVMLWPDKTSALVLLIVIFVCLFLYYLSYQAYNYPDWFSQVPKNVLSKGEKKSKPSKETYVCNGEESLRLQSLMMENQYYLDQDLTISSFAQKIQVSPRLISNCINQNLGQNFNEWVNGFRVRKALELIQNDRKNKLSIEGIGQESGFKSRSALYAAFKNKLGFSPGEFRRRNLPIS